MGGPAGIVSGGVLLVFGMALYLFCALVFAMLFFGCGKECFDVTDGEEFTFLEVCARVFEDELRQQCASGDARRVTALLDAGVPTDPPLPGALCDAPLLWAASSGHTNLVVRRAPRAPTRALRSAPPRRQKRVPITRRFDV